MAHTKMIGKQVTITTFDGLSCSGVLTFVGISPIHKHFGSKLLTYTVGRLPLTCKQSELPTVEIFKEKTLIK